MPLDTYRTRRNFTASPEPAGAVHPTTTGRLYIIQKHAARRLHYDLRLELDGVLKSWAIPKGPSLDPRQKRLAVHVEDHPVEYGSFEGIIPKGQYGGGTVLLWDRGEWEPVGDPHEGLRKGILKFRLNGEKLKGAWVLVRLKPKEPEAEDKNWILIKERDPEAHPEKDIVIEEPGSVASGRQIEQISDAADRAWVSNRESGDQSPGAGPSSSAVDLTPSGLPGARRAPFPGKISPELATLVTDVPEGGEWLNEIKYDGYRIICFVKSGKARLITRNDKDWTDKFSTVGTAITALPLADAVLDGEMVVLSDRGGTDFQALQNVLKGIRDGRLTYYIFDVLYYAGYDLTRSPLRNRKQFLSRLFTVLIGTNPVLRYGDHIAGKGGVVFAQACRLGFEGIIAKRADSPYEQQRTRSWRKVKCTKRQEFVIGGYTEPSGARSGFGALLLGYFEGDELIFCGRVGTGFDEPTLKRIFPVLKAREVRSPPFTNPPTGTQARGVHWVRPDLVAEVDYSEWTEEGVLRHPSFKGLREDKEAKEVGLERARNPSRGDRNTDVPTASAPKTHRPGGPMIIAGTTLTNPDRVLYPEQGITKLELASYYEKIAEWILPHLVNRPLTLVRCPEGPRRGCFYQKHLKETLPESIRGIRIQEKSGSGIYLSITDLRGLIALVQLAALEIHPWGCREETLEFPDRLIFDLDPGPETTWKDLVRGAKLLRERLLGFGLTSFLKTTGGKGLHVVVPVRPEAGWDEAKAFTRAVAMEIAQSEPDRFVATMAKKKRVGKIFVDYVRNSRGATAIAPYSTRARTGCPLSTPLAWEELSSGIRPDSFTIRNIEKRVVKLKRDPWEGFFDLEQSVPETVLEKTGAVDR